MGQRYRPRVEQAQNPHSAQWGREIMGDKLNGARTRPASEWNPEVNEKEETTARDLVA